MKPKDELMEIRAFVYSIHALNEPMIGVDDIARGIATCALVVTTEIDRMIAERKTGVYVGCNTCEKVMPKDHTCEVKP